MMCCKKCILYETGSHSPSALGHVSSPSRIYRETPRENCHVSRPFAINPMAFTLVNKNNWQVAGPDRTQAMHTLCIAVHNNRPK